MKLPNEFISALHACRAAGFIEFHMGQRTRWHTPSGEGLPFESAVWDDLYLRGLLDAKTTDPSGIPLGYKLSLAGHEWLASN